MVVQVSPDYQIRDHEAFVELSKVVRFEYMGDCVDRYVLSQAFMALHNIEEGQQPLPELYPDWVTLVKIECRKCFEG